MSSTYRKPIATLPASQAVSTSTSSPLATRATRAASATPIPTIASYPFPTFIQLRMFSPLVGWAVSGYDGSLLHTEDGGETWIKVTPPDTTQIAGAYFLNGQQTWGSGMPIIQPTTDTGSLYHTTDGGATWQTFPTPFRDGIYQFLDADTGVAIADTVGAAGNLYFRLYRTFDRGRSWSLMHIQNPYGLTETLPPGMPEGTIHVASGDSFRFQTPSMIWFGGGGIVSSHFADLYVSRDAGKTWRHIQLPLPEQKPNSGLPVVIDLPTFFTPQDGVFDARYEGQDSQPSSAFGSQYLATYITHDGGRTWKVNPDPVKNIPYADKVDFVSLKDAFVACGDNLCASNDGEKTWQMISSNLHFLSSQDRLLTALDFIDAQTGWAVISQADSIAQLYETINGGRSWSLLHPRIASGR